jgi:hypothetical protein
MRTDPKAGLGVLLVAVTLACFVAGCGENDQLSEPRVEEPSASLTPIPAPIVWHRFDGDTYDSSGNGHDAVVYGDPVFVDGCIDGAVHFDGVDDRLKIPADAALEPVEFTVELYFKPDENLDDGAGFIPIVVKLPSWGNFWNTVDGYDLWYQDSGAGGRLGAGLGSAEGTVRIAPSQYREVEHGEFHHLVETFDGSKVKLYIDGFLVDVRNHNEDPAYIGGPIWIGGNILHSFYGSGRFFFRGVIDEFALYDYAFSPNQVRERSTRCRADAMAIAEDAQPEPRRRIGR